MNYLNSNSFLKRVFTLSLGSTISQVIGVLFIPVLSRLYSPEDFGIYSSFTGLLQVLILLSTLKFEKAIILPEDPKKSLEIGILTIIISILFTTFLTIILTLLRLFDIDFFGKESGLVFLIPFSILSFAALSTLFNILIKRGEFGILSKYYLLQSFVASTVSLLLGLLNFEFNGLIYGWLSGSLSVLLVYFLSFRTYFINTTFLVENGVKNLLITFKRYQDFPKFYTLYDLLSTGLVLITPFIILNLFSKSESGLYGMAYRILMIPFIVISSSIGSVFAVQAGDEYRSSKNFSHLYIYMFKKVLIIGLVIYIVSFFFGGWIITFFLGAKWEGIDFYIKIMSIWLFFEFIVVAFKSNTFIITEKQKTGLKLQVLNISSNVFCLFYFSGYGIKFALIAYSISSSIFALIFLCVGFQLSKGIKENI